MKKLYKRFIFLGLIFLITFSLVFVRFDAIASCVNLRINGLPGQRIVIRGNVVCNNDSSNNDSSNNDGYPQPEDQIPSNYTGLVCRIIRVYFKDYFTISYEEQHKDKWVEVLRGREILQIVAGGYAPLDYSKAYKSPEREWPSSGDNGDYRSYAEGIRNTYSNLYKYIVNSTPEQIEQYPYLSPDFITFSYYTVSNGNYQDSLDFSDCKDLSD